MKKVFTFFIPLLLILFIGCASVQPGDITLRHDKFIDMTTVDCIGWQIGGQSEFESALGTAMFGESASPLLKKIELKPSVSIIQGYKNKSFVFSYVGGFWLFIEEIIFLIDDEKIPFTSQSSRSVVGGKVIETAVISLNDEFINKFSKADSISVRLSGKKGKEDCEISKEVQTGISKYFIDAEEMLKNKNIEN